jgi:hypothetical protein
MTTISGAVGPGELTASAFRPQPPRAPPAQRHLQLPPSTSSTSTTASNTNRNRGLSTSNKAETVIVALLGVAAIAGIVFLLMRLHRNTRLLREQFESVQNQLPKTQYTQVPYKERFLIAIIAWLNYSPRKHRNYMGFTVEAVRYQWRNQREDRDDGYGFTFWNDVML